jgi:secreted trypsin-like serine protease
MIRRLSAVALSGISFAAFATPPSLSLERLNRSAVQVSNIAPVAKEGAGATSARVDGNETSACTQYGRKSAAQASAHVDVAEQKPESVALLLGSSVSAAGGHYRTCGGCLGSVCVGIEGHDTSAQATASAGARLAIQFDAAEPPTDYRIAVGQSSQGTTPRVVLRDAAGGELALRQADGNPAVISGGGGHTYYLSVELPVHAENGGGCCDDTSSASARVDVKVLKAPILSTASVRVPFILGGQQTPVAAYRSVGALLIDGELHCTGTLVGQSTVLTAAHCLNGYENQISDMSFVLGANVHTPTSGPFHIVDVDVPRDTQDGFRYNPQTYEDDIGVAHLSTPAGVTLYPLHSGNPAWATIDGDRTQLFFVGYGYNVTGNDARGAGVKREVALPIDIVENRRVAFKVNGKGTCQGDSGGPAFLESGASLVQTSVTSGSTVADCSEGVQYQTRVDAFLPWLQARIR